MRRSIEVIDQQIASLNRDLQSFIAKLPASPLEAYEKADRILGIHDKLAKLLAQKNALEDQIIGKSRQIEEVAIKALSSSDDLKAQLRSINAEIAQLEDRLVEAEIEGDEVEQGKINMMISSLRSRRSDLIERARASNVYSE